MLRLPLCSLAALTVLFAAPPARAMDTAPDTATHLRAARALRTRSRESLAGAAAEYRAILRRAARNEDAERGLARVLRDEGREEDALPYLRDVAGRSHDGADEARLGWALFRAGYWSEANDAFSRAREHGYGDPETVRGQALAAAAARAALADRSGGREAAGTPLRGHSEPLSTQESPAEQPTGWQTVWATLWGATGAIAAGVQHLVLGTIALLIAAGIALRVWSTLMGRDAPRDEGGMPLRQLQQLRVLEIDTGRPLGRVRDVIYDPKLARVVGVRMGGWRGGSVAPWTAVRGVGPGGLLLADAGALLPVKRAGELGALARFGTLPLGHGNRLKRIVTEDGALVAFTRPHRLWIDGATGQVTFEATPNRFHDAWRIALGALQFGPVDWLLGKLLDWGLELLPGHLSVRIRLPASLIRSADRDVVIVSGETAEWIEQHFRQLEVDARARLEQVKEGVARAGPVVQAGVEKARPVVKAGVERAKPVVQAGVEKARPVLEKALDTGTALARRSAEAVMAAGRKGAAVGGEEQRQPDPAASDSSLDQSTREG
jgi:hypothetical protein